MASPATGSEEETGGNAPAAADGSAAPAPSNGRKGSSRDPKVFVLLRELSEVHLLLDNVSANPSTTVSELASDERLAAHKLKSDWIEQVCNITWPPDGSDEEKAGDAALLIRAKDFLNRLSHPASGSTIAFTLLVTQEDMPGSARWWQWRKRRARKDNAPAALPDSPTRSSLAQTAYPDLIGKAVGFRRAMWWISIGLVVALLLTCALSWYVAYGNAALAELATARQTLTAAQTAVDQAETADWSQVNDPARGTNPAGGGGARAANPAAGEEAGEEAGDANAAAATPAPAPASAAAAPAPRRFVGYCATRPYADPTQSQLCEALLRAQASLTAVELRLADWLCWEMFDDCQDHPKVREAAPSRAVALANIMGSAVLPFLYGLLGAGAAIIRSLSRKIRASLLSPRDLHLSFQQLALGAVVGACIGLFVAAPGGGADGENLLGPVTLSASAISFVAGFGVEAVFQALEALITRIFNITQAPTANRGDGLAAN